MERALEGKEGQKLVFHVLAADTAVPPTFRVSATATLHSDEKCGRRQYEFLHS